MKKSLLFIIILLSLSNLSFSQDRRIDQLEVLYSQDHFTKVLRKANKLLAIPDYDYSGMPIFYKSLALFRLLENEDWTKKNKDGLREAISAYNTFLTFSKIDAYIKSHYFEIAELKQRLIVLQKKYKPYDSKKSNLLEQFINSQLKGITSKGINTNELPVKPANEKVKHKKVTTPHKPTKHDTEKEIRNEIVLYAMKYIGTPYSWAGTTPNGFDCSGYTGYVLNNFGVKIPRSASAQKEYAIKINEKQATKGDLAFFKTGNKITHVGIIISDNGEPLKMIHASSSKGIITTNIESSSYWNAKFAGIGRVIH